MISIFIVALYFFIYSYPHRCLAVWSGCHPHIFTATVTTYFRKFVGADVDPKSFPGVTLAQLPEVEKTFDININVYQLTERDEGVVAEVVQRSHRRYDDSMNVNMYENHFSYIRDMDVYCQSYACSKCGKLWKTTFQLNRHEKTCEANVQYKYVGGTYHLPQTIFEKLEDEGIDVPEQYYPYRATYDFECYFDKSDLPANTDKLTWTAKHVPLSVSVSSNVPGYETPTCFITDGDPKKLVLQMLQYLDQIADAAYAEMLAKFTKVFEQLQVKITDALIRESVMVPDDADDEAEPKKHPLEKLQDELVAYLQELPVVGFNSGKYDINATKPYLMSHLQALSKEDGLQFVVKKNNNFMCLKTAKWKFVDVLNYLAPGFSYEKFLKAFDCSTTKGFLPYEWLDSLDRLESTELPPHEAFYSSLKKTNISEDDYAYCQQVWQDNKMTTFRDFLTWYNNRDVGPFLEALEKQSAFYQERGIDMLKAGISVPGLTLRYLFQRLPHDTYFTLFDEKNSDLHDLLKSQIVGGPSLILHRYHEKDETKLKEAKYGEAAKTCEGVTGFDCNALYLWCIMQDMPTGWFVRRRADNDFKPEKSHRQSRSATEWLEWVMTREGIEIRHAFNGKEKRIGQRGLPVDGWCKETQTVYQFHGCFFHGHDCRLTHGKDGQPKVYNDVKKCPMRQLREETENNTKYIRDMGYKVVELWECEWQAMKAEDRALQEFVATNFRRPLDRKGKMTEDQVKKAVLSGELFGLVQ